MAPKEDLKWECPTHPGTNTVVGVVDDAEHIHVSFKCGCTVEFHMKDVESLPTLEAGDAVLWAGELFRLDAIKEDDQGVWGVIINIHGEDEVLLDALEYVARDTLTGTGMAEILPASKKKSNRYFQKWDEDNGYTYDDYTYNGPTTSWKQEKNSWKNTPKKKKPVRRDSISTSSLIEDEVRTLKNGSDNEDRNVRPLRTKPTRVVKDDSTEDKPIIIPKRRGDW